MKHFALLLLWLVSALFGCNNRNSKKPKQDLPWFPNTDNPAVQVMEIPLDSGYTVQTFFVSPERKELYVLAHNRVWTNAQYQLENRFRTDYQLLHLDAKGQVLQRLNFPDLRHSNPACLWMEHDKLVFFLDDRVRLYDAESMKPREEIPCYVTYDFPTAKKLKELFPEEQLALYLPAREKALKKSVSTRVLSLPAAGGVVLLLEEEKQKRSVWSILDSLEADQFTRQYGQIEPPVNPGWNYNADTGLFRLEDGNMVLETTKKVSMGTQLDYPNYKSRSAMQYELLIGDKKARFATTNRFRYPLYVFCAQNDYLSASGTEAWIAYDGKLYRLE